jgi:hypothetical protein
VAVATYALLASGVVPGVVSLVVLAGLLAVVPTSPDLSRRIALNGSVLVGWVPVLWWVRWPFEVSHGALVVAVVVGALTFLVTSSPEPRLVLRSLLPHCRAIDSLMVLAGVLALTCMSRWAFVGSPHAALVALLPGADNYAHFHMFATIREYGATTTALGGKGDGSGWAFDEYPQGFHALAATLSELTHPHMTTGADSLVAYTQVVSLVVVVSMVVLVAAVVSLPGLRQRPMVALPAVVFTCAAFLWEPGPKLLADGFANFWLASAAVAIALLLSLAPGRRLGIPDSVAVAGLLVAVAYAWAPLIVIAAPAVVALLHPVRRTLSDRALRPRLGVVVGVLGLAGLAVLRAVLGLFADVDVKNVVTAIGGVHGTNPLPAFVLIVVAVYACVAAVPLLRRYGGGGPELAVAQQARVLVLAPVAGLLLGSLLFIAQLRTVGTSSYYFLKFFMGFELVLAGFVPALCGFLVAVAVPRSRRPGLRVGAAVGVTLLATQAFGQFPHAHAPLHDRNPDGTASVAAPFSASRIADGIIAAVDGTGQAQSFRRDYLAIGPDRAAEAFYPNGWYHASLASLSAAARSRLSIMRVRVDDVADAVPVARELLLSDPDLVVVVDPAYAEPLRRGLGAPELGARVTGWSSRASVETDGER